MSWKKLVVRAALSGTLLLGGALLTTGTAQAQNWGGGCRQRVEREEWNLQRDIERHGYSSRQANNRRHELREARQSCGREDARRWNRSADRGRDNRNWRRDRDDRGHQGRDDRWRRRHGRDWDHYRDNH